MYSFDRPPSPHIPPAPVSQFIEKEFNKWLENNSNYLNDIKYFFDINYLRSKQQSVEEKGSKWFYVRLKPASSLRYSEAFYQEAVQ